MKGSNSSIVFSFVTDHVLDRNPVSVLVSAFRHYELIPHSFGDYLANSEFVSNVGNDFVTGSQDPILHFSPQWDRRDSNSDILGKSQRCYRLHHGPKIIGSDVSIGLASPSHHHIFFVRYFGLFASFQLVILGILTRMSSYELGRFFIRRLPRLRVSSMSPPLMFWLARRSCVVRISR